jgi:Malectin domain
MAADMTSSETERRELDRVIELLGGTTRPARLLAYIGASYFQQGGVQLTEFSIATEVFGRSPQNFDSTEDAVVRVEAHRLRKKLREIYARGQSPHGVQISVPAGSYVLKFLAATEPHPPEAAEAAENAGKSAGDEHPAGDSAETSPRSGRWVYLVSLAVVAAAVIIGLLVWRGRAPVLAGAAASKPVAVVPDRPHAADTMSEIHILSGHTGSEVIDNSGVKWTPDQFFSGGAAWSRTGSYVRGTSRQFLFATQRSGQFGYDIPLERGTYEMRLFFLSPSRIGDEKVSSFNVTLNDESLLLGYDANMSAGGADVADEKVFRDITPGPDGRVRLGFYNAIGTPEIYALELVPGEPGRLKAIRITTQPTAYVDHQGRRWRADDYYLNGFRSVDRAKVTGTDDPELFSAERYGHFSYAIPVDPRDTYTVVLHFAEIYFGPQLQGGGGAGSRVFHVFCNGQTLLRDFDIFREAGSLQVVTKTFPNIRPSAQGKINLTFEPVVNNATVSAIEILDEPH